MFKVISEYYAPRKCKAYLLEFCQIQNKLVSMQTFNIKSEQERKESKNT